MDIQSVTLEPWPTLELPKDEVKATLQFLAHKTKKPVSLRRYTKEEGYSNQTVSVQVFVNDSVAATYSLNHVTLNGETLSLSSDQRGMGAALVRSEWMKIADEEGQLIGCVDHNRIIVPIDITATDNDAARAILAYVVERAIPLLDFDLDHVLKEKEEEFTAHFTSAFQQSVKKGQFPRHMAISRTY